MLTFFSSKTRIHLFPYDICVCHLCQGLWGSAGSPGIDEMRNKDNEKCNSYIRAINKMLWGKERFFLPVVISGG